MRRSRPLPRRAGWRCNQPRGARRPPTGAAAAEADAGGRGAGRRRPAHAGAAEEAGRARRRRVARVPQLKRQLDGKAEALFLDSVPGATLAEGLQKALDEALAKLPIPKVMSYQLRRRLDQRELRAPGARPGGAARRRRGAGGGAGPAGRPQDARPPLRGGDVAGRAARRRQLRAQLRGRRRGDRQLRRAPRRDRAPAAGGRRRARACSRSTTTRCSTR